MVENSTYTAATHEYDAERFKPASSASNPDHTDEKNHAEYVLNARKIDTKDGAELCWLQRIRTKIYLNKSDVSDAQRVSSRTCTCCYCFMTQQQKLNGNMHHVNRNKYTPNIDLRNCDAQMPPSCTNAL